MIRDCRRCGYESDVMHAIVIDNRLLQYPQQFNHGGSVDIFWLCMSCETDLQMFLSGCQIDLATVAEPISVVGTIK